MAIISTEQPANKAIAQNIVDALARDTRIDVKTVDVGKPITIELER